MNPHKTLLINAMRHVECSVDDSERGAVARTFNEGGEGREHEHTSLETIRGEHRLTIAGATLILPELSEQAVLDAYAAYNQCRIEAPIRRINDSDGSPTRFTARIVQPGESYGVARSLVNTGSDPTVEIYDNTYAADDRFEREGQIIGSWYARSLLKHEGELDLQGGVPEWNLTAGAVENMQQWIKDYFSLHPAPRAERSASVAP